ASTVNGALGLSIIGVGGLVGSQEAVNINGVLHGRIDNSFATGNVTGSGLFTSAVGGLLGSNFEGSVTNSSAFGRVTLNNASPAVGGLVGADGLGNGFYSGNTFNPGLNGQSNGIGNNFSSPGVSPTTATGPSPTQGPPSSPPPPSQTAA